MTSGARRAAAVARPHGRGFTLIEVLVVLVIVGILSTAVVLSVEYTSDRSAQTEARRLALLLEAAMLEAHSGGRQLGWSSDGEGYAFWERSRGAGRSAWQPLRHDARFGARRLPEGVRLSGAEVDGTPLRQQEMLILRPVDPPLFRLRVSGHDDAFQLRGLPTGRVEVGPAGQG